MKLKHGHARNGYKSPEYRSWEMMHQRCNPNNSRFLDYGGRGITVCKRWMSFKNFLADMGPRPSLNHSIERKDNNGNYDPSNCVWATRKQQQRNRRTNVHVTFRGKTRLLIEWVEQLNLTYHTIQTRLLRGWSVERAFTAPIAKKVVR